MFNPQRLQRLPIWRQLREEIHTLHLKFVLAGLSIGLFYFPVWVYGLLDRKPQGADGFTLATVFVGLGIYFYWKQRRALSQLVAQDEDRLLGYILIACSVALFPFCRFAIWPQALLWLLILAGIACSTWGFSFFYRHQLLVLSAVVTAYPRPAETAALLWQAVTPYEYLEQGMATAGAAALRLLGWQASAQASFVIFPEGAVDVDWGCNGFDMALTMVVAGLAMGLFLKQSRLRILGFITIGIVAALLFNIPRIMLLAISSVYWGEGSFKFWHGPIGGQIFSTVLFTAYYYTVMGLSGMGHSGMGHSDHQQSAQSDAEV